MELYLFRHGETEWTLAGRHTGWTDLPLTENGKIQAQFLGERLKSLALDAVYSSPLIRARQTALIAGFQPFLDPDLREWNYGDYEGKTHSEIQMIQQGWNLFQQGVPNGESPQEIGRRVDRFLEKVAASSLEKVGVFSHGHLCRVIAARWLGLDPGSARYFSLSVASMSVLGVERVQRVLKLWNDTSHLKKMSPP